jgi:hypothetical protein
MDDHPNDEAGRLVRAALNKALNWIYHWGDPLIPFLMTLDREGRMRVTSFLADEPEIGIRRARRAAERRAPQARAWAVVFASRLGPGEAVVADVGVRGWNRTHRWIQRFQRPDREAGIRLVGEVVYAGIAEA